MVEKRNFGSLVVGAVLICMGALALFEKLFNGSRFWGMLWPLIIIGFGLMFFVGMFLTNKSNAWLAIPGSIIVANGLMLFLQNLTGNWETWSYSWTVILMSVGAGIFIMGAWQGNESRRKAGLRVFEIGAILFVVFGAFFEMLFSLGAPASLRGYIFPIGLILLGLYIVIRRSGLGSSRQVKSDGQPVILDVPVVTPDDTQPK
jgi:hypothetical protein